MSPSGQRVVHSWNPAEVLNLANPAKHGSSKWSCPAPTSKKIRCLKTRDATSYNAATHLLREMSIIDPANFLDNQEMLVKLAGLTLCAAYHLPKNIPGSGNPISNVDFVVTGWVALISAYIAKKKDASQESASSADPLRLKSELHEDQRHRNSTLAVVDEALSATDSWSISQHRLPGDRPIKVEGYEVNGHPDVHQTLHQTFSVYEPPASGAAPDASDQLDREAFKALTLENNRLKTENAGLQRENDRITKKLARVERELKAAEKKRDDIGNQVDEVYKENNELADRLESLAISRYMPSIALQ